MVEQKHSDIEILEVEVIRSESYSVKFFSWKLQK